MARIDGITEEELKAFKKVVEAWSQKVMHGMSSSWSSSWTACAQADPETVKAMMSLAKRTSSSGSTCD